MKLLGSILLIIGFLGLLGTILPVIEDGGSIDLRMIPLPALFLFAGIFLRQKHSDS
ncbi:MAG: hypothetical protein ACQETH_14970 [Candidatus Rifleibacteriota bacterium]